MNKLSICEYFVWENHIILHLYISKVKFVIDVKFYQWIWPIAEQTW